MTNFFSPQFRVKCIDRDAGCCQDTPDAHQAVLGAVRTGQIRIRQCQQVIPEHFNALKKIKSLRTNFVGTQLRVKFIDCHAASHAAKFDEYAGGF